MRIAILGAGVSGLTAAGQLQASGQEVVLFDKGRGPGGRMSTRRADVNGTELTFDHGAPSFTVTRPGFQSVVDAWIKQGVVGDWAGPHLSVLPGTSQKTALAQKYYVGRPKMNALIRHLADAHDVSWRRRATAITRDQTLYEIAFEEGPSAPGFSAIIFALPHEQTIALGDLAGFRRAELNRTQVKSKPCWSVMLAFDSGIEPQWSSLNLSDGPIAFISRENSKPDRQGMARFVVHASTAWSAEHIEAQPATIVAKLMPQIEALTDLSQPVFAQAHRWRFAQAEQQLDCHALWDSDAALGICGDWLSQGPGIESAWHSGSALAHAIIARA